MSTLKINFEKLRQEQKSCFDALERAFTMLDIDFYLIGARARDIWLEHLDIRELRTTTDVDLAIHINISEKFQEISEYLCATEKFQRKEEPYKFSFGGMTIDLLPFGDIERDGSVWLENPPTELSVFGMREVTEQAEVIEGGWKVVTLPGLIVLKLIAFSEKPERRKDIQDVELILRHYHEIAPNILWEAKYEDLLTDNIDTDIISARILGRQIGGLLSKSTKIRDHIVTTLDSRLQGFSEDEINAIYENRSQNYRDAVVLKLLLECKQGIQDIHM